MGVTVGGDPASVGAGGAQLRTASRQVGVRSTGIIRAGSTGVSACGGSPVAAACARFVAAYSQFATGLSTELNALGTSYERRGRSLGRRRRTAQRGVTSFDPPSGDYSGRNGAATLLGTVSSDLTGDLSATTGAVQTVVVVLARLELRRRTHGSYWNTDDISLRNIGLVVAGAGDQTK